MLGLTTLGVIHTGFSLIALAAGALSFIRFQKITWENMIGKVYVVTTILTCLTAFGIFRHGGFGKGHVLAIVELVVLIIAFVAAKKVRAFGGWSPYVETVAYSLSFFFHLIPGITETATRFPQSGPLASGPDDPIVKTSIGVCFVLFLIGATLQVLNIRRKAQATS